MVNKGIGANIFFKIRRKITGFKPLGKSIDHLLWYLKIGVKAPLNITIKNIFIFKRF